MVSKSEQLRAKAAEVANRRRESTEKSANEAGRTQLKAQKVSLTVQLQESYYDQLKAWPERVGLPELLGRKRIPTVEVMRALVEELMNNTELRDKIVRRVLQNLRK